jgi:hypothetical protein
MQPSHARYLDRMTTTAAPARWDTAFTPPAVAALGATAMEQARARQLATLVAEYDPADPDRPEPDPDDTER